MSGAHAGNEILSKRHRTSDKNYYRNADIVVSLKMLDDVFAVGAASADEDGKFYIIHKSRYLILIRCHIRMSSIYWEIFELNHAI